MNKTGEIFMVKGINHITFAVADINASFNFYTSVLGLKPVARWDKGAYLKTDEFWIALNVDQNINKMKQPDYSHVAFTCTKSDFPEMKARILEYGCIEWSKNVSEGESLYFLDPDGHKLEIHVGDLESRLKEMKMNAWAEFEFY